MKDDLLIVEHGRLGTKEKVADALFWTRRNESNGCPASSFAEVLHHQVQHLLIGAASCVSVVVCPRFPALMAGPQQRALQGAQTTP